MLRVIFIFSRLWHSPTFTTWGSFATRTLSLIVVLPLVLNRFTTEEIALWYLFSTIISLQLLVNVGFNPTFYRVIAYAMGGASNLKDFRDTSKIQNNGQPNWQIIEQICLTMRAVYWRLNVCSTFLLATLGTWFLTKPISATTNVSSAWIAWGVILLTSTVTMRGNVYSAYLQGINQIALLRRWEIFTSLGAIFTSSLVLLLDGGLLGLVVANQGWLVVNIVRNRWLCGIVESGYFKQFIGKEVNKDIFDAVWPSVWRSGIGMFLTSGLTQISSLIYAQIGSTSGVASYLLALRLIQTITQLSQAPFYSKLPALARLRSQGKLEQQIQAAKRGMKLSYWTYVTGFIGLGLFATPLLKLIGSNAEFVSPLLWSLMGLSLFVERFGAMHLQLYSTTNHIIWHTVTSVYGAIYVVVSLSLFNLIGVYAFPVGVLAGQLGFYSWYSAKHSYQAFGLRFWSFERSTMLGALVIMLFYIASALLILV